MSDFTPTQGRYLAFIHAYTNLHGFPPAEAEIAAALRVSPPSVNQMVKMLEKKGLIRRRPGEARSIQIQVPADEIPPWQAKDRGRAGSQPRRKQKYITILINGRQKRVLRPSLIEGLPAEEFIASNANPIWLHENELWEMMNPDDDT